MLSLQPDGVLCARAARGNEDAFAVLHNRYRQQVFAFVYHLLGRAGTIDDAEDLTQEIMQKAYANASTQRSGGSFKSWLFRIARNHTFDHIRARRPVPLSIDQVDQGAPPSNVVSLSAEVERRAEFSWMIAALAALPDRQREALVLRELGGASVGEIAETLETTPESAKQLIKRARGAIDQSAREQGLRAGRVDRKLAAAAPITAVAWLGTGKASAAAGAAAVGAAGAGGAAATGVAAGVGSVAVGAGSALTAGKVVATVLAVAAIGTGGVVATEQVSDRAAQNAGQSSAQKAGPAVPAQSLTVGAATGTRALENKAAANRRRAAARKRAQERRARAIARSRAKRAAARGRAKARAKGRGKLKPERVHPAPSANSNAGGGGKTKSPQSAPPVKSQPAEQNSGSGGSGANGTGSPGSGKGKPKG